MLSGCFVVVVVVCFVFVFFLCTLRSISQLELHSVQADYICSRCQLPPITVVMELSPGECL